MCPLRVLLIFLSATLAGFFVLRSLKSDPQNHEQDDDDDDDDETPTSPKPQLPLSNKVGSAICNGFWTFVDMASGRYLWKNLIAPAPGADDMMPTSTTTKSL